MFPSDSPDRRPGTPGPEAARPDPTGDLEPLFAERRTRHGGEPDAGMFPSSVSPVASSMPELASDDEPVPEVPVRRLLSLAIAGFAGLLTIGLIFGAQTAGPGNARVPYAVVIFGVQLLFILAWTSAIRPPALPLVAGICVLIAVAADAAAVLPDVAGLAPLGYVAVGGFLAGVLGQLVRRSDRSRVTESLGATLLIVLGVLAFATLIVLTRKPIGTQAVVVCLGAAGVALVVARATDTFLPWPRMEPQVPRGAAGVVLGTMAGTFAAGVLGIYLVGFTPSSGAIVGLVAAGSASLVDLACNYAEAGRQMAGQQPTMWIARHMQGPLGGFALAAPAAYAMSVMFLT